jgi:S1-C subfamily serine protease
MSRGTIGIIAACFLAGLAGGGIAVLAGATNGGSSSTVTVSAVTAGVPTGAAPAVARVGGERAFDASGIYRAVAPGVVTVSAVVGGDPVDGSGFVVSADGHVITNAHVVTDSPDHGSDATGKVRAGRDFFVHFQDGNTVPAKLVGFDLFDDIAVLKIDPTREPLTVLQFGRARDLKVGDQLAVIGSPFGEAQQESLSTGVVAALNREIDAPATDFTTPGVIQTDAAINHGNSGGPVLDRDGHVVGVAAQILTEPNNDAWTGIGFAVPAESVQRSFRELVATGKVPYAWLGVATRPVNKELARTFKLPIDHGLLVNSVTPDGPAATAGLTSGSRTANFQDGGVVHPDADILVAFNGQPVTASPDLGALVALAEPDSVVPVDIYRAGQRRTIQVRLGNRPDRLPAG